MQTTLQPVLSRGFHETLEPPALHSPFQHWAPQTLQGLAWLARPRMQVLLAERRGQSCQGFRHLVRFPLLQMHLCKAGHCTFS